MVKYIYSRNMNTKQQVKDHDFIKFNMKIILIKKIGSKYLVFIQKQISITGILKFF